MNNSTTWFVVLLGSFLADNHIKNKYLRKLTSQTLQDNLPLDIAIYNILLIFLSSLIILENLR